MAFVEVRIGPVSAGSARVWLEGARQTMAIVRSRESLGVPVPVIDAFDRYLDEWSLEMSGDVFFWSDRVDQEMLRHLAAHWARLVNIARDQPDSGITTAMPAGEEFFSALASGLAEALAVGDDDGERFAPRFEEVVPDFVPAARPASVEARRRVMLVDDNADIRMLLRIGLETTGGFSIIAEAGNGQEALDAFEVECPDVVLLDLSMPVMDGLTALPLLVERCAETRVVVFSANDSPSARHEVAARGGFAFLRKDTAIADIADVLRAPDADVSA